MFVACLGKSTGLYMAVVRELENWLRYNEHKVEHLLTDDLKQFAFQVSILILILY